MPVTNAEAIRRYLAHAIAPDAPRVSQVRLEMKGEIRLGRWWPFRAHQTILRSGDFVWAATVRMYGLPIRGEDRLESGAGSMNWKLFGAVPVMTATGPDTTRSAIGRAAGELLAWLPSALSDDGDDPVHRSLAGIRIELDANGRLRTFALPRWGNPGGAANYSYVDFGAVVEAERTFGAFTVPSRVRAGWFFGTPRFESDGEFFRAEVDRADYE